MKSLDTLMRLFTGATLALVVLVTAALVGIIVVTGAPSLSPHFLFGAPSGDLLEGGIGPALFGTCLTTVLMTLAGVPVGVTTAIYLSEIAPRDSRAAAWVRTAVRNLAAVPSVVFGLFGLGFFVMFVGRGMDVVFEPKNAGPVFARPSILWASLTLSVLTLPVVIVATEEALHRVPRELREASHALGATRMQTIVRVLLPHARAGILTGVVLATSRAAGEVAPIMLTGVVSYLPHEPTDVRDGFMHLGNHVYVLATQSPDVDRTRPLLFGTVLVLVAATLALNAIALVLRQRSQGAT